MKFYPYKKKRGGGAQTVLAILNRGTQQKLGSFSGTEGGRKMFHPVLWKGEGGGEGKQVWDP